MFNIYWPYKSTLSISDILIFLTQSFQKKNIPYTISDELDPISHNIIIENINDDMVNKIILFCKKYDTKISLYVSEYIQKSKINGNIIPLYKDNYYVEDITKRFKNIFRIKKYISSLITIMLDDESFETYKNYLQISNCFNFVPDSNFKIRLNDKNHKYDLFFFGSLNSYRNHEITKLQKDYKIFYSESFLTNEQRYFYLKNSLAALHLPTHKQFQLTSPLRVYFAALFGKFTVCNISCLYTKAFTINTDNLKIKTLNKTARFDMERKNMFDDFIKFIKNKYY